MLNVRKRKKQVSERWFLTEGDTERMHGSKHKVVSLKSLLLDAAKKQRFREKDSNRNKELYDCVGGRDRKAGKGQWRDVKDSFVS